MIKNYLSTLLNLIFPNKCLHCQASCEELLCSNCLKNLKFRLAEYCNRCGAVKESENCPICEKNDFHFDEAKAVYDFVPELRSLIHNLKYKEMQKVGRFLGKQAGNYLRLSAFTEPIDIIAPVPLHRVKKRIRGYNQANVIAKSLGKEISCNVIPDLIIRTRFTQTQTRLTRIERKKNVSHAFSINPRFSVEGRVVLLVDDVFTTGATMNSMSEILQNGKAKNVYVITIAKA